MGILEIRLKPYKRTTDEALLAETPVGVLFNKTE